MELRFFGGLTEDEAAEVLKVSRETVKRDWRLAKVWLLCELSDGAKKDESLALAGDRAHLQLGTGYRTGRAEGLP